MKTKLLKLASADKMPITYGFMEVWKQCKDLQYPPENAIHWLEDRSVNTSNWQLLHVVILISHVGDSKITN